MKFQVATEPTQLEIKTSIEALEANNGLLVDNVGKKYLPVMNNQYDFRTIEGENVLLPLQESLMAKFPDLSTKIDLSAITHKYHIANNIHFIYYSDYIIIMDMNTLTVLNAVLMTTYVPNWWGGTGNVFLDDNYIYIRGGNKGSQVVLFVAFDKLTYQYVSTINWNAGVGNLGAYTAPFVGEIVRYGNYFALALADQNVIQTCRINYDSLGKPTSITGIGQIGYANGNAPATAFWGDDEDNLYVVWNWNSIANGIEKKKFNRSNGSITLVATNQFEGGALNLRSYWSYKYTFENTRLILIVFGNSNGSKVLVINYDSLTLYQSVYGAVNTLFPTFDYQNKNLIYFQPPSIAGTVIDGNGYDIIAEGRLVNGKWKMTHIYVPTYTNIGSSTMYRTFYVGNQYGVILNGNVYVRAFEKDHRLISKANIISHYKEVLK